MSDVNSLFRERIGLANQEILTFEMLDELLEKTAETIPFENLCIIENRVKDLSNEGVIDKILHQKEGGLCYELNSILYLFLKENGFDAKLIRGVVFNQMAQQWGTTGRTHVAILVRHNEELFLVDTGFGGNIPLRPVPLTGEVVSSHNGEFRVKREKSEHGDYIFYMKLKHKHNDWKLGYAFDSTATISDVTALNEVQTIISQHPESTLNKEMLVTKLTDKGSVTLTPSSLTEWIDGQEMKKEIDAEQFKLLKAEIFGLK